MEKIIHYCWFGKKELPNNAIKCINSWKKYLPDYKIKEWNEDNFDIHCCNYIEKAYKAKKWAFVSDYARFWILYNYGGLYFDTDVELIRNLEDLICQGPFMGCEQLADKKTNLEIAPGLGLYALPKMKLYKEVIEYYNNIEFEYTEGEVDTVVTHVTNILKEKGFKGDGRIEKIEDIKIYPPEYFCPMNAFSGKITITPNTYTIHHYEASWQSNYSKVKTKIRRIIGPKMAKKIINIKSKIVNK